MHSKVHVALEKNNKKKTLDCKCFVFFQIQVFPLVFFFIEDYE